MATKRFAMSIDKGTVTAIKPVPSATPVRKVRTLAAYELVPGDVVNIYGGTLVVTITRSVPMEGAWQLLEYVTANGGQNLVYLPGTQLVTVVKKVHRKS